MLRILNIYFFISEFTIINAPIYSSKTQPISNWQVRNGLCSAFSNLETNKLRHFDNTIAHWSMQVRLFLRNLQMRGTFIVAFTSEK